MSKSQSQMYVLKYNLKRALENDDESAISEAEKKQLRQVERTSKNITRAFYVYAPLDMLATGWWLSRSGSGTQAGFVQAALDRQGRRSRLPLAAGLLTLRIAFMQHVSTEASKRYLADNVSRILRKSNPMRDELLK